MGSGKKHYMGGICYKCTLKKNKKWRDCNKERVRERDKCYNLKERSELRGLYKKITRQILWKSKKSRKYCSWLDFQENFKDKELKCEYCDIDNFTWYIYSQYLKMPYLTLQIDRKDNNLDYEKGNMVFACPVCNLRVKNETFNYEETKEIAQKYIKPRWQKFFKNNKKNIELITNNFDNSIAWWHYFINKVGELWN